MIRALSIAILSFGLTAPSAVAEQVNVSTQAIAARADFLLRATPPAPAATICLVDTGVNETLETTAVIGRFAQGAEAHDTSPTLHGTRMAMMAGAASNGFGMVGLWPAVRILSIPANTPGTDAFSVSSYINAIKRCSDAAVAYGIKVVALPSSSTFAFSPGEQADLLDEIAGARETGISFVAAAGNTSGLPPGMPASLAGVLSVGAGDSASHALCGFSAQGASIIAPGCRLDSADPLTGVPSTSQQGTSEASVIVATALAALRTWRPEMTPDDADRLLIKTSTPFLDVTAAFVAAGLAP